MKTENNLQNKAAFIAQYWGQEVLKYKDDEVLEMLQYPLTVSAPFLDVLPKENHYLELTDLKDITDSHACTVYGLMRGNPSADVVDMVVEREDKHITIYDKHNNFPDERDTLRIYFFDFDIYSLDEHGRVFQVDTERILETIDYLRSKGYLLGWRGLIPQDIINYEWVKVQ